MKLSSLLSGFSDKTFSDMEITGLALDSRQVKPGDLFFALPGANQDGRQYIDAARQQGAVAVITEDDIPNLKAKVGEIASKFYHYPSKKLQMVGVTGTSGKTSCTQFIGSILHQLNQPCGIIGTLGNGLYGQLETTNLTTPDAITIQKTLTEFLQHGAKKVAMEVSSHSLDQGRVGGIEFEVGIFTNLTREHLDYHKTMEAYGAAKKRLFEQSRFAVINADDAFGREMLDEFDDRPFVVSYGITDPESAVFAEDVKLDASGIQAMVHTPWGSGLLKAPLAGQFNLSNLLSVLSALCALNIPLPQVLECIARLDAVPGRMQALGGNNKPTVIVDYAHKPDALEKVLIALRQQCHGKLYCIFGCGGGRDRGKRSIMAKIAEQYADQVIVTDDNPRHEDPAQIVSDILTGFSDKSQIIVQHDRSKAIHDVIQWAKAGDYVLIAGKGAETYQQIGDQKISFNDIEKAREALGEH